SRSCTTTPSGPAPISRFRPPRSWRSASNSRFDPPAGQTVTCFDRAAMRGLGLLTRPEGIRRRFRTREDAHGQNGREAGGGCAVRAVAAAGGSSKDVLLDLAWRPRRPGVDLFS